MSQDNMVNNATGDNSAPNQNQDEGDTSSKAITLEQMNAAITARNRAFEKSLEKKFEDFMGKLTPKESVPEEKHASKEDARVAKLEKELAAMNAKAQAAEEKRRSTELRTTVNAKLASAGINPSLVKAAMAVLVDSERLIQFSEDGESLVFRTDDGEVDLDTGIKSWIKSGDGKNFLAPKGMSGSGDRGTYNNKAAKTNGQLDQEAVFENLMKARR